MLASNALRSPFLLTNAQDLISGFDDLVRDLPWEITGFVNEDGINSSGSYGVVAIGRIRDPSNTKLPASCVLKLIRPFRVREDPRTTRGKALYSDFNREYEIMKYVKDHIQGRNHLVPTRSLLKVFDFRVGQPYYSDGQQFVEGVFAVERLEGGDLFQFVKTVSDSREYLTEDQVRHLLLPVFQAIKLLHAHHIVHNDLKIENLVFRDKARLHLVIVDFGLAYQLRWVNEVDISTPTFKCSQDTPPNFSPEQRRGRIISPANDIYAMGYLLQTVLSYCGVPRRDGTRFISAKAKELIRSMMAAEYARRISIDDVLASSWFSCQRAELLPQELALPSLRAMNPNDMDMKLRSLRQKLDSIKQDVLLHFADALKVHLWHNGDLQPISSTQFKSLLNDCTGLGMFQEMAEPVHVNGLVVDTVIDINGDGEVDALEITLFLRALGLFSIKQLLNFLFHLLDCDGDHQISTGHLRRYLNQMISIGDNGLSTPNRGELDPHLLHEVKRKQSNSGKSTPLLLTSQKSPVTPISTSITLSSVQDDHPIFESRGIEESASESMVTDVDDTEVMITRDHFTEFYAEHGASSGSGDQVMQVFLARLCSLPEHNDVPSQDIELGDNAGASVVGVAEVGTSAASDDA